MPSKWMLCLVVSALLIARIPAAAAHTGWCYIKDATCSGHKYLLDEGCQDVIFYNIFDYSTEVNASISLVVNHWQQWMEGIRGQHWKFFRDDDYDDPDHEYPLGDFAEVDITNLYTDDDANVAWSDPAFWVGDTDEPRRACGGWIDVKPQSYFGSLLRDNAWSYDDIDNYYHSSWYLDVSLRSVLTHEIGHLMGMAHTPTGWDVLEHPVSDDLCVVGGTCDYTSMYDDLDCTLPANLPTMVSGCAATLGSGVVETPTCYECRLYAQDLACADVEWLASKYGTRTPVNRVDGLESDCNEAGNVNVSWVVYGEELGERFALERSWDGWVSREEVASGVLVASGRQSVIDGTVDSRDREYGLVVFGRDGASEWFGRISVSGCGGGSLRIAVDGAHPFRGAGQIRVSNGGRRRDVRVNIYSVSGRLVRQLFSGGLEAADVTLPWDGRDDGGQAAAAGVYVCVAESDDWRGSVRLLLLR